MVKDNSISKKLDKIIQIEGELMNKTNTLQAIDSLLEIVDVSINEWRANEEQEAFSLLDIELRNLGTNYR
jgi:hypothetical protein